MRLLIASTPVAPIGNGIGGGVDFTISVLVKEFIKKGHFVEVVAPKNSFIEGFSNLTQIEGEFQDSAQTKDFSDYTPIFSNSVLTNMWEYIKEQEPNFDIIFNFAYDWLPFYLAPFFKIPVAHFVSMSSMTKEVDSAINKFISKYPQNICVYTKTQAKTFGLEDKMIMVGMGINLSNYKFSQDHDNSLAWIGRISKEKGLEDAFCISELTGCKVKIMGKIQDEFYWENLFKTYPKANIEYLGFLNTDDLQKNLRLSQALLFTSKWVEAFGIVVIESLACGVPVIAYDLGGPSEIIENEKSGFLVKPDKGVYGFVEVLKNLHAIDRNLCRERVENNFSTKAFSSSVESWLISLLNLS